jgi:UDP-2,3-diacylglucosamine pyrophosphatase LpxH
MSQSDAIVISDVHLGAEVSCAKQLTRFLREIQAGTVATRQLVLNGDVFDSWDFRRLKKHHWKSLSALRHLSKRIPVTWVVGNHDGPADIVSHLIGVNVVEEHVVLSGERRVLVLHGHQFDRFLVKHPIITYVADLIYRMLQKMDPSFRLARAAKCSSKTYLRCTEKIADGAIARMREADCDAVCCGHTHFGEESPPYFNSGSWAELPCTYLTIQDGRVKLREYDNDLSSAAEEAIDIELFDDSSAPELAVAGASR